MAANQDYIDYPIVTDARDLMAQAFAYLKAKVPGWEPSEGQLDTWMIEAFASEAADIGTLTSQVPRRIAQFFGSSLYRVYPLTATPAIATATIVVTDDAGHTVRAGTQVGIRDSLGNLQAFYILTDVTVPQGQTSSAVGAATLVAVVPGLTASNVGSVNGDVELIDTIEWIESITQETISSGGANAETVQEYLDRLTAVLQTISPRPILPVDFAILARNIAGVQRATALDGYNPLTGTFNNARTVTVVALDSAGNPVSDVVKSSIASYLQSLREQNFLVYASDPTVIHVDINVSLIVKSGYSTTDVAARVHAALTDYLDPATWGISGSDNPANPQTWNNSTVIYLYDVTSVVKSVAGVDHIETLQLGASGGVLREENLDLVGIVPLPNPGTITATAH